MPRPTCYDLIDQCYEKAQQDQARQSRIRHLSDDKGTFIGVIVPTKRVSHGSERLFYVDKRGRLIPRALSPAPFNQFQ